MKRMLYFLCGFMLSIALLTQITQPRPLSVSGSLPEAGSFCHARLVNASATAGPSCREAVAAQKENIELEAGLSLDELEQRLGSDAEFFAGAGTLRKVGRVYRLRGTKEFLIATFIRDDNGEYRLQQWEIKANK